MTGRVLLSFAFVPLAFVFATAFPATGQVASVPAYPVEANCREATSFLYAGSTLPADRKRALVADCIELQQNAYDEVRRLWPALQAQDQDHCRDLVQTGNYVLLDHCVVSQYAQEVNAKRVGTRTFKP